METRLLNEQVYLMQIKKIQILNDHLSKENDRLKSILGVTLKSNKKGHSQLTSPIVERMKELLSEETYYKDLFDSTTNK